MTVELIKADGTTVYFTFATHCAIQQFVDALEENEPDYQSITIKIVRRGA
jgi:hypothetical protein